MATVSNPNNRPVVTAESAVDTGVSVAIDYTTYYERIATALETIATNSTAIKDSIAAIESDIDNISTKSTTIADKQTIIADKETIIADKQTIIADKQTAMETYQKKLKELGETVGIRVIGPYELVTQIPIYKLLIEQGKILDITNKVSDEKIAEAKAAVDDYVSKISADFPKAF